MAGEELRENILDHASTEPYLQLHYETGEVKALVWRAACSCGGGGGGSGEPSEKHAQGNALEFWSLTLSPTAVLHLFL